jgi:hypothetical protein
VLALYPNAVLATICFAKSTNAHIDESRAKGWD